MLIGNEKISPKENVNLEFVLKVLQNWGLIINKNIVPKKTASEIKIISKTFVFLEEYLNKYKLDIK